MSGFMHVRSVLVPHGVALQSHIHLRQVGLNGLEGMALWAGTLEDETFHVRCTIIPEQDGRKTPQGLLVSVPGEELHKINVWLYQNQMTLIAQLHSHPREAYHSDTDDAFPIVTAEGGLSLVVPDFARHPMSLASYATYRYLPPAGWTRLSVPEAGQLIRITE